MWPRAVSEPRRGDTLRARDDLGAERLRSTLRRHTGYLLAGGRFPGSRPRDGNAANVAMLEPLSKPAALLKLRLLDVYGGRTRQGQ
jgi:hypothetical protein